MAKKTKKALKGEAPKAEAPKAETPKIVKPKVEDSKLVTPKELKGYKNTPITHIQRIYTKAGYRNLIEAYKLQNPKKYAQKASALETKFRSLK